MERNETINETKTTVVIPTELLDDFKHGYRYENDSNCAYRRIYETLS